MSKEKIAITLDKESISELDKLVNDHVFNSRSQAIQEAVKEKLQRVKRGRLAIECAKLKPEYEKAMAEEGIAGDIAKWPKY